MITSDCLWVFVICLVRLIMSIDDSTHPRYSCFAHSDVFPLAQPSWSRWLTQIGSHYSLLFVFSWFHYYSCSTHTMSPRWLICYSLCFLIRWSIYKRSVKPRYKHILGRRRDMLITGLFLYRGKFVCSIRQGRDQDWYAYSGVIPITGMLITGFYCTLHSVMFFFFRLLPFTFPQYALLYIAPTFISSI